MNAELRKANLRLALVLASIAAALLAGFVVRMIWVGV